LLERRFLTVLKLKALDYAWQSDPQKLSPARARIPAGQVQKRGRIKMAMGQMSEEINQKACKKRGAIGAPRLDIGLEPQTTDAI
jgi:hypothetical protein